MDIRKPKAIHNWREFLKEVGTIVLGVCIALAAEQGIEYLHWRNLVTQARQSFASEMAQNTRSAIVRLRTFSCTEQRLDALAKILDAASRSGSLPPVGIIGAPPRRQWSSGAWDSVMASQVATHFPRAELTTWARAFSAVDSSKLSNAEELKAWSDLNAMVGPGRRLDPASEADLRKALGMARTYNRQLNNIAYQVLVLLRPLNPPYSQSDLDAISTELHRPLNNGPTPGANMCQPIGAVPPEYGQTALTDYPDRLNDGLKLLPDLKAPAGE